MSGCGERWALRQRPQGWDQNIDIPVVTFDVGLQPTALFEQVIDTVPNPES